jgi:hypothetical protein
MSEYRRLNFQKKESRNELDLLLRQRGRGLADMLGYRAWRVLQMTARGYTDDEIGRTFNISRGRITQIRRDALMKLDYVEEEERNPSSRVFDMRTINTLRRAGIKTLGDLRATPIGDLVEIPNFGVKSLEKMCRYLYFARSADGNRVLLPLPRLHGREEVTRTEAR